MEKRTTTGSKQKCLGKWLTFAALILAGLHVSAASSAEEFRFVSDKDRDKSKPYDSIPKIRPTDRIGWCADGNNNDPDDWVATPVALAIFAAAGLHDQFVHFSYNNRLDQTDEVKMAENNESVLMGAKYMGFDSAIFFDLWKAKTETKKLPGYAAAGVYPEYDAAVEDAIQHILASSDESRFYWIQAGPFEFAFRVLQEAVHNRGATEENIRNTILASHSATNENEEKWKEIDALTGEPRFAAGAQTCVETFGVGFFFTGAQGRDRFGGKDNNVAWEYVEWMKTSDCPAYPWMHSRFVRMSEFFQSDNKRNMGRSGLDASDAGMAYTLVMGDYNGDLDKFSKLVHHYCGD